MSLHPRSRAGLAGLCSLLVFVVAACSGQGSGPANLVGPSNSPLDASFGSSSLAPLAFTTSAAPNSDVAVARQATAAFHDLDQAMAAGWSIDATGCLASPAGGMGHHYVNFALFDGVADPTRPEALLYEPRGDGTMHLVGVEYIVPTEAAADPPALFGQEFHLHSTDPIWILHVWLWKPNPSGIFSDWNPQVACPD